MTCTRRRMLTITQVHMEEEDTTQDKVLSIVFLEL